MVTFNYTKEFLRQAKRLTKRYRSLPDDINILQHDLIANPEIGVSLGEGKRKIRLGVQSVPLRDVVRQYVLNNIDIYTITERGT